MRWRYPARLHTTSIGIIIRHATLQELKKLDLGSYFAFECRDETIPNFQKALANIRQSLIRQPP